MFICDLLAEIAFHAPFGFDRLRGAGCLFLGKVLDFLVSSTLAFAQANGRALPDAVDRGQADPKPLLRRQDPHLQYVPCVLLSLS
jgi:hypothetical protein